MKYNQGFIGRIILLIMAVIALKYFFDFDVVEWVKSDRVQNAIAPAWDVLRNIYDMLDNFVRNLVN